MKLAVVNNNFQLGGAETVARQVHFGLMKRGHQSRFYVSEGEGDFSDSSVSLMYPKLLARLDHSRFRNVLMGGLGRYPWTDRFFRSIARSDVDLVHVHSFHGIYASLDSLAYLARRKPVVWTFHRFWGITGGCDHPGDCRKFMEACGSCPRKNEWPMNGLDRTSENLVEKLDKIRELPITIISPSQHLAETVRNSRVGDRWRVEVIYNGIDPTSFSCNRKGNSEFRKSVGVSTDSLVVFIVNRDFMDPLKGYDIVKGALAEGAIDGVQVVFAGRNSEKAAVDARELGWDALGLSYISDQVRLRELYEASDIFLYASPGENFPCAVIEAMSSGACIVSTPTDGVKEQVENGVSGILSEDFSAAALRDSLNRIVWDRSLRESMGQAARARVAAEFSEEGMIDLHESLFSDLVQAWRPHLVQ